MIELFLSAFVTLFVVLDPPGCAPIYAGLTVGASPAQKRSMALKACLIAGAILLVFALFGEQLLAALHIELDAFRTAGSVMLLVGSARGLPQTLVVLAALLAVLVLTLLALWAASPLMKLVGAQVEAVITRLLGVLLAALAVQYVIDGIRAVIK